MVHSNILILDKVLGQILVLSLYMDIIQLFLTSGSFSASESTLSDQNFRCIYIVKCRCEKFNRIRPAWMLVLPYMVKQAPYAGPFCYFCHIYIVHDRHLKLNNCSMYFFDVENYSKVENHIITALFFALESVEFSF